MIMKNTVKKYFYIFAILTVCLIFSCIFVACNKEVGKTEQGEQPEIIPDGVILATDNGVKANDLSCAKENTAALNALIASVDDNSTIYLPRGNYYFDKENEFSSQIILAKEKNGLTLQGDGAVIINSAYNGEIKDDYSASNTLKVEDCKSFKVKGLNFDYYRYTQIVGDILEDSTPSMLYIKVDERFLRDGDKPAITGKEYVGAVGVVDETGAEVAESYDGDILHIKYAIDDDGIMTVSNIVLLEKLKGLDGCKKAILRFSMANYSAPVFQCFNNDGFTFENISSYSSPSSTMYIAANNKDFSFDNFNVATKENSPEIWASNVDVIHINGLRGQLTIKNSLFKGLGDDALNIHSRAGTDFNIDKESKILTLSSSAEDNFALVGDTIEFFNLDFVSQGSATVIAKDGKDLTLDNIPENVDNSSVIQNKSYCADTYLENVTVDCGRARAFLFQTDNVTVKNCVVKNMGLAAIIISPDINEPMAWFEVGPSKNVTIENCTFENVCARNNEACFGAIVAKCDHDGSGISHKVDGDTIYFPSGVHKSIKIKNNTFDKIGASAVFICATDYVEVIDNTIKNGYANVNSSKGNYYKHSLCFVNCNEVYNGGNGILDDDYYEERVH